MKKEKLENILVTGSAGQIGSELVPALCKKKNVNIVVAGVLNNKEKSYLEELLKKEKCNKLDKKLEIEYLDVRDKHNFEAIAKKYDIHELYHLAGILSAKGEENPSLAFDVNLNGLINALEVARKYNIKVFWPSSIAVFGPDAKKEKAPQDSPLHPITMYGLNKKWGEELCKYYSDKYDVDIRSVRFPGIISYKTLPGGGTTDYAVQVFYDVIEKGEFNSPLKKDTRLPMMYMPDATKAIIEIMDAPKESIKIKGSYNVGAVSFTPEELAKAIEETGISFKIKYKVNPTLQKIADSWVNSLDDSYAKKDWGWHAHYDDLFKICEDMIYHVSQKLKAKKENTKEKIEKTVLL